MIRLFSIFCVATLILLSSALPAEILKATIRWTPLLCQKICIQYLNDQFLKIPGIAKVTLNQAAGQADLEYKPYAPFSFDAINYALAALGLPAMDVRVQVRGTIQHSGTNVFLISLRDGTRFTLLNPVVPNPSGEAFEFNIYARYLRPPLLQTLLAAEAQQQIATISGPLFMPERGITQALIVEQISLANPEHEPARK